MVLVILSIILVKLSRETKLKTFNFPNVFGQVDDFVTHIKNVDQLESAKKNGNNINH